MENKLKDIFAAICKGAVEDEHGNNIAETYLKKTGDSKDSTVSFTSADSLSPAAWTDAPLLTTGEKHSSILNKISTMFKNIRWLYKMLGTTNIADIGGGTLTGAVSKLNTDILKANEVKYYNVPQPPTNSIFVSFSHWVFNITKIGRVVTITTNFAAHMKAVPLTADSDAELLILPKEYRPYALYKIFTYVTQDGFMTLVNIGGDGRIGIHNMAKEINGWLCRWTVTYIAGE